MTPEEKQLLLIDLCARLPYGVKYCRDSWNYEWDQEMSVVEVLKDIDKEGYINYHKVYKVDDIKPYLRPMSSLIGKELDECRATCKYRQTGQSVLDCATPQTIDYLISHHFDYRIVPSTGKSMIESGLALEALEGMYKNE